MAVRRDSGLALHEVMVSVAALLVAAASVVYMTHSAHSNSVKFLTPYQAVLLTNGSVYFGRLEDYGSHQPVLREVYYVVTKTDPNTKAVSNVLVKRGKELHEPDRMYLNPNQILFVEPVGQKSRVMELIQQSQTQP